MKKDKIKRYFGRRYVRDMLEKVGGYKEPICIRSNCVVTENTFIGKNCSFNGIKIYGKGKVTIGDNFHGGINIRFITSRHNYEDSETLPYGRTSVHENIIVGDNVWMGNDVLVLGDIRICEGVIIQAGAIVVSGIPYCGIAGGSPAKVFKYRDIKHYEKLKSEKKFFKMINKGF